MFHAEHKHDPLIGVEVVASLLRELGLGTGVLSPLLAHARAVRHEGDRLGLISRDDLDVVLPRHTADSLLFALVRAPAPEERWVDVGSGAGFPGMVLGICYPDSIFTLLEPQSRRAGFLDLQCLRLGLTNVSVHQARAQELAPDFDVATARALAEPSLALEAMKRLVEPDGTVLLAVGDSAPAPPGVLDLDVSRSGVDSPGRILMLEPTTGGA